MSIYINPQGRATTVFQWIVGICAVIVVALVSIQFLLRGGDEGSTASASPPQPRAEPVRTASKATPSDTAALGKAPASEGLPTPEAFWQSGLPQGALVDFLDAYINAARSGDHFVSYQLYRELTDCAALPAKRSVEQQGPTDDESINTDDSEQLRQIWVEEDLRCRALSPAQLDLRGELREIAGRSTQASMQLMLLNDAYDSSRSNRQALEAAQPLAEQQRAEKEEDRRFFDDVKRIADTGNDIAMIQVAGMLETPGFGVEDIIAASAYKIVLAQDWSLPDIDPALAGAYPDLTDEQRSKALLEAQKLFRACCFSKPQYR